MFCGAQTQDNTADLEDCKKIEHYIYKGSDKVGEGNFSQVFHGIDTNSGRSVAIKVIKYSSLNSKVSEQLLKNEASILKELKHQNVLRCLDIFSSKNNCYIITEFYEGGDLQKLLFKRKMFQEKEISRLVYQIYKGLLYLNQLNIVHRDLKLANIFLDQAGNPKIADFGFAVKSPKPFKDINIGSPIYMSPEGMLLHQYGPATQVWAFGVMIYELLHGDTPLSSCRSQRELREKIMLPPHFRQGISLECRKFIDLCLKVDPKHRIEMKDLFNTAYMSRLNYENENMLTKTILSTKQDLTSSISSTLAMSSNKQIAQEQKTNNVHVFLKFIRIYEEALAFLHYCRLIHKVTQGSHSKILSHWLLIIICWLPRIKLQGGQRQKNQKLISIAQDYSVKYREEHSAMQKLCSPPNIEEVQKQIEKLINKNNQAIHISSSFNGFNITGQQSARNNNKNSELTNLFVLRKQTQLLRKTLSASDGRVSNFSKFSESQKYLDSLKFSQHGIFPVFNK